jgi:hypothetical protein
LSRQPALQWSRDGRVGVSRCGGRYLIHRWDGRWILHYLAPPGVPVLGVVPVSVPWTTGSRRSLAGARQSCAEHARQLAAEQSAGDRGPIQTRD